MFAANIIFYKFSVRVHDTKLQTLTIMGAELYQPTKNNQFTMNGHQERKCDLGLTRHMFIANVFWDCPLFSQFQKLR